MDWPCFIKVQPRSQTGYHNFGLGWPSLDFFHDIDMTWAGFNDICDVTCQNQVFVTEGNRVQMWQNSLR